MRERSLGKTLKNLVLALLNATLILLAVCLWLGLRIASEVRAVSDNLHVNLTQLQPLQNGVTSVTSEIAGLRADLAAISERDVIAPETVAKLRERARQLDTRLTNLSQMADQLAADPGILAERAASAAITSLGNEAQELLGCRRSADAPSS